MVNGLTRDPEQASIGSEAHEGMKKRNRQRGFWEDAWPLVPGMVIALVPWLFRGHDEFGFPNSTASNVFIGISLVWNGCWTAWALQRGAPGVFARVGMGALGLFGGFLVTIIVFWLPWLVMMLFHFA